MKMPYDDQIKTNFSVDSVGHYDYSARNVLFLQIGNEKPLYFWGSDTRAERVLVELKKPTPTIIIGTVELEWEDYTRIAYEDIPF